MSPIAFADLESKSNETAIVDDTSVFPAANADHRLKKLWAQHGDPQSLTYSNPELTSLSFLVRYNGRTKPEEVAYLVPQDGGFASTTWKHFDHLTDYAAAQYSRALLSEIQAGQFIGVQPTIALLGSGNTFSYWVSEVALLKLGVRILLLSDKNADVARDHLLQTCNAVGIVVEQKYELSVQNTGISVIPLIPVSATWDTEPISKYVYYESDDVWNQQAMIIHSSGSTGLPKPIIHTNRSMMLIARMYRLFQSFIVENWYLCFPLFHIAGVSIILGGLPTGMPTSFPPEDWPPSPGSVLGAWRKLANMGHPVDCLHCAPSVIEDLYEYLSLLAEQDFSQLISLKQLQPGGAALSPTILKKLVDLGVNVKTTYGSTEIGPPFRTIPDSNNPSCYKVRSLLPNNPHVAMEPLGENLYECIVYKGFPLAAELWLDPKAPNPYRTNDLFIQDPPDSGLYVLQGRKDDMIVHSNGEKTNALPLQLAIEESHPAIQKAVVFGTEKPCTSAIIEVAKNTDLDDVYEAIDNACKSFPSFSRLDRSLILSLSCEETLPVTPKGNVRRKEAQKLYGERLDSLYEKFSDGVPDAKKEDETSSLTDMEYIRSNIGNVCGIASDHVHDGSSFYTIGMDSQKAVQLRSRLTSRFGKFPLMFIFEYPSAAALCAKLTSRDDGVTTTPQRNAVWIQDAISRYKAAIGTWTDQAALITADRTSGEVIYLTGATGALGNALLAAFCDDVKVSKVYCAIRGSDISKRLEESLRGRGYGPEVYASNKLVEVPYDMKDTKLGLNDNLYEQLADEITAVVHNAWKMDFNQQVDMFEDDCLKGTLNLMRFACHNTKKTFAFTSSVATNMGKSAAGTTIQETPIANDLSLALETGYAQSKFIVEVISQTLASDLGIPVRMFRVGQLCGHSALGSWNVTEMFPIMIATGLRHLNAMPVFDEQGVNWLPVDICAESICTMLVDHPSEAYTLHNLVNPATVSWPHFLDSLEEASGVAFERISMLDWVERLQVVSEERDDVPGAKLLGFFEGMAQAEEMDINFENAGTAAMVPRLRDSKSVDAELLRLYLQRWGKVGFAWDQSRS